MTAVGGDSHVTGSDTEYAISFGEDLRRCKAGVDIDPDFFALCSEPLDHIAQRRDVIAVLVEGGRTDGKLDVAAAPEHAKLRVVADVFGGEALLDEVGHQFLDRPGIDDGSGKLVIAEPGGLFDDQDDGHFDRCVTIRLSCRVLRLDLLDQMVGRGQIAGPRSDVEDVDFHAFSFGLAHHLFSDTIPVLKSVRNQPLRVSIWTRAQGREDSDRAQSRDVAIDPVFVDPCERLF